MLTNRDKAKIEAEPKAPLINADPFCPVRLSRILNNGRATDKFMVEIEKEDGSGFVEIPGVKGVHSANYRLVTNRRVHDMAAAVMDKTGMTFKPVPSFSGGHSRGIIWNGASYIERWYAPDVMVKSPQGTQVMLGMEVHNSYDKACKVGLSFFGMHVICSNQFFSRNLFGVPFDFTHIGGEGELDDDFDRAFDTLQKQAEGFGQIAPRLELLGNTRVETMADFLDLRQRMADTAGIILRDREVLDELHGIGTTRKCGVTAADTGIYGDPGTYWALANAITAIATHLMGGLRGQDYSERAVDFLLKDANR